MGRSDREIQKQRHIPQLKGATYCAPFCGYGCTLAQFQRAQRKAFELAAKLGSGWAPRVWENLGWHYCVEKGVLEVHPHVDESGGTVYFHGAIDFTERYEGKNPRPAITNAHKRAAGHILALTEQLREIGS